MIDPDRALADAHSFWRQGRHQEAIAAFEARVRLCPEDGESWYNLGFLQRQARRFEAALRAYARALETGASNPQEIHLNRAVILADHLASPDAALAELEAALGLDPEYFPALLNLGNLREDRGEREAACEAYEKILTLEPGNAAALARLANASRIEAPDDPIVSRLKAALAQARDPQECADLGFALGRALDAVGSHAEAFTAYAQANRAVKPNYDRAAQERLIDALIAAFPERGPVGESEGPSIFICGLFRSGSTLIERILAGHSRIRSGGELDLLPALVAQELPSYPAGANDAQALARIRRSYIAGLPPSDGRNLTDKRPDNFLHIGLIKRLWPSARIVHTIREPLDNILSLFFLQLGPEMPWSFDLDDIVHWHGQHQRLMAHWQRLWPDDIFAFSYDELVIEPEPALRRLLDFLGLDWEEGLLDFHRAAGVVKTASVWQVREPLYARASGRWRNYARQLARFTGDDKADSRPQ